MDCIEDADIDAPVAGAVANKFRNAGQECISANRFYVPNAIYERFVSQLAEQVVAIRVGKGAKEGQMSAP